MKQKFPRKKCFQLFVGIRCEVLEEAFNERKFPSQSHQILLFLSRKILQRQTRWQKTMATTRVWEIHKIINSLLCFSTPWERTGSEAVALREQKEGYWIRDRISIKWCVSLWGMRTKTCFQWISSWKHLHRHLHRFYVWFTRLSAIDGEVIECCCAY
jgi:hypothetical protein